MESLLAAGLVNLLLASALAAVVALVAWRCRRPALLHTLWLLVLIKLLTPPLLPIPVLAAEELPATDSPPPVAPRPTFVMVADVAGPGGANTGRLRVRTMLLEVGPDGLTFALTPILEESGPVPGEKNEAGMTNVESKPTRTPSSFIIPPSSLNLALAALWGAGSGILLCWTFVGLWRFHRLLRFAEPAPDQMQRQVRELASRMGLRRSPAVWLLPGPLPPLVWAVFGRARLYFPRELLQRLDDEGSTGLLAHELAHLCRRDHWVRWLELAAVALYWWCPVVWWVRSRLRACEEECCDALAVDELSPRVYAGAILETVDFLSQSSTAVPAAASTLGRVESLKRRLTAIMTRSHCARTTRRGRVLVIVLVCLLPVVPGRAHPRGVGRPVHSTQYSVLSTQHSVLSTQFTVPSTGLLTFDPWFLAPSATRSRVLEAGQPVLAVALTPDGRQVILALENHQIDIRDVATGQRVRLLTGHEDAVTALALSPDGRTLASGSPDRTVRLWDLETGEERSCLKGHTSWVYAVAFSPDGKTLASAGYDRVIRLWDTETGAALATLEGPMAGVRALAFSPDGVTLASAGGNGVVRVWDVPTGKVRLLLVGHERTVRGLSFGPEGKTLASGSEDGSVRLWDVATGKERAVLRGKQGEVWSVRFCRGGRFLLSGGSSRAVQVWDTATLRERQTLKGHTEGVTGVALTPDGTTILSVGLDGTARVWGEALSGQ
jgi:beta-lactamase regulating signal transducer with metallopeptidase domain